MPHPHADIRQNKVEHSRVAHITRGYATGGAVKSDATAPKLARASGGAVNTPVISGAGVKARQDRPGRARGGRAPQRSKTNVNVIIAPQGAPQAGVAPSPAMAAPPMPKPPMMPPPGPPMGAGPMPGGPMPMPPRSQGGRTYASGGRVKRAAGGIVDVLPKGAVTAAAKRKLGHELGGAGSALRDQKSPSEWRGKMRDEMDRAESISDAVPRKNGGAVKSGPAWEGGRKEGTQVTHSPGKGDLKDMNRGRVITYKTGGRVGSENGPMGPKFDGGAGGGTARLQKESRAERKYKRAP